MKSKHCPYTITFYGALFGEVSPSQLPLPPVTSVCVCVFVQGDVMICMELMHKSLHEVYKLVYDKLGLRIPEPVVGRMAESVSFQITLSVSVYNCIHFTQTLKALHFLKEELKVLHRGKC